MNTTEERMEEALGTQLRVELAERGMSQSDLADAVGVGRVAINKYIRGHVSIPMGTFVKVAGALGITPDILMSRVVERASREEQ